MNHLRITPATSLALDSIKARMARVSAAVSGLSSTEAGLTRARDELRAMAPEIELACAELDALLPPPAAPVVPFRKREDRARRAS